MDDYCIKAPDLVPEIAPDDQPLPWDAWDAFIDELEAPQRAKMGAQVVTGGASAAGPTGPCNVMQVALAPPAHARLVAVGVGGRLTVVLAPPDPTLPWQPVLGSQWPLRCLPWHTSRNIGPNYDGGFPSTFASPVRFPGGNNDRTTRHATP